MCCFTVRLNCRAKQVVGSGSAPVTATGYISHDCRAAQQQVWECKWKYIITVLSEDAGTCQDTSKMRTPRFSKQVLQEAFGLLAGAQPRLAQSSVSHADGRGPEAAC